MDKEDGSEADDRDTEDETRGAMALCALDDDALRIVYGGLSNPLYPGIAVAFSSLSKGLWEPTKELHKQLRDAHKVAAMLCRKMGMLDFHQLCDGVLEPHVALKFSNASQRLWESGPQLLLQGLWEPTPPLLQLLEVEHEAAEVLCTKMRMRSCKVLRESKKERFCCERLNVADLTTLGTLGAVLPELEYLGLHDRGAAGTDQAVAGRGGSWRSRHRPGRGAAGTDGVQRLAEGLGTGALPAVNWLDVNRMHVGDAGASALAAALGRGALPQLKLLGLTHAAIGDAGLVALAPALRRRPALERLYLGRNPFGDEGIAALVAPPLPAGTPPLPAAGLKKLKLLDLEDTQVTDVGCATLASAIDSGALPALGAIDLQGIPASAGAKVAVHEALHRAREKALRALLVQLNLGQFADAVVDAGYDTPELLSEMDDEELAELASSVGMGPGHNNRLKRWLKDGNIAS